jgi:acyl-coenzyme A synthetase/AMP-(fatty) acid ligase
MLAEMPVTSLGKIMKPELARIAADLPRRGQTSGARVQTA